LVDVPEERGGVWPLVPSAAAAAADPARCGESEQPVKK
jgi:hypothetical protein